MRATLTSRDRIADAGGGMGHEIREMFARVAGRYDCLNHLLSLGLDRAWRRRAVGALAPLPPRARVLDVCAGTLDFALTARKIQPDVRLVGADFCLPMLVQGRKKRGAQAIRPTCADALRLPFRKNSFEAAVCGFGVRNLDELQRGIEEIFRVLRPGGKAAVLEFFRPECGATKAFHRTYGRTVIPLVGGLVSGDWRAYRYLPSSVNGFCSVAAFEQNMREAGFRNVWSEPQTLGVATLVVGEKP
jgi:ubiquinone/menaquinone biosynthesis methyltransferase